MIRRTLVVVAALTAAVAVTGCPGGGSGSSHTHADGLVHEEDHGGASMPAEPTAKPTHGEAKALGTLHLAGHGFELTLYGGAKAGAESGLEAKPIGGKKPQDYTSTNLYAWVEDADGKQLSAPDKAKIENAALHFHLVPKANSTPSRVVIRYRGGGVDERAGLPLDGHGHDHTTTPHDGVMAGFSGSDGAQVGFLELKLHDDKGDLELWLGLDDQLEQPFDIDLDTVVAVRLVDAGDRSVALRVRNRERNEDEDGNANVRDGKTNYFIFPGDSGVDASWLKGAEFSSIAVVSFSVGSARYTSDELMLVPHTHGEGAGHGD